MIETKQEHHIALRFSESAFGLAYEMPLTEAAHTAVQQEINLFRATHETRRRLEEHYWPSRPTLNDQEPPVPESVGVRTEELYQEELGYKLQIPIKAAHVYLTDAQASKDIREHAMEVSHQFSKKLLVMPPERLKELLGEQYSTLLTNTQLLLDSKSLIQDQEAQDLRSLLGRHIPKPPEIRRKERVRPPIHFPLPMAKPVIDWASAGLQSP